MSETMERELDATINALRYEVPDAVAYDVRGRIVALIERAREEERANTAALTREVEGLRAAPKEGDERRRVKEMMGTKTHRRFIIAHETLLWVPKARYVPTEYRTREEAETALAALSATTDTKETTDALAVQLRTERDTLRATVAGLREATQAFMAANDDYLHQFLNPDGSEVRWQAMAKAQDDLRTALAAVPTATPAPDTSTGTEDEYDEFSDLRAGVIPPATPAPDGRRDADEGSE